MLDPGAGVWLLAGGAGVRLRAARCSGGVDFAGGGGSGGLEGRGGGGRTLSGRLRLGTDPDLALERWDDGAFGFEVAAFNVLLRAL